MSEGDKPQQHRSPQVMVTSEMLGASCFQTPLQLPSTDTPCTTCCLSCYQQSPSKNLAESAAHEPGTAVFHVLQEIIRLCSQMLVSHL